MRIEAKKFGTGGRAALLVVALSLLALAQGCVQSAPAGGETGARSGAQTMFAQPSPTRTAQSTPTPTPAAESPLPPPRGFVNDFADVIDAETEGRLESRLRRLKASAKIEIGVATVETTGGQDIHDYSLAVARGWGIGPPAGAEGGGILLLLTTKERKWQIQVSRSLEADLPNDVLSQIGAGMVPALRAGRYGDAVNGCVDGLVKRLAERRGLSTNESELNLQTLPEEKPKPAEKPKAGDRRKNAPGGKP